MPCAEAIAKKGIDVAGFDIDNKTRVYTRSKKPIYKVIESKIINYEAFQ